MGTYIVILNPKAKKFETNKIITIRDFLGKL